MGGEGEGEERTLVQHKGTSNVLKIGKLMDHGCATTSICPPSLPIPIPTIQNMQGLMKK